jgi:hypothetical protein
MRSTHSSVVRTGVSRVSLRLPRTPGRSITALIADSSKVMGSGDPSMNTPCRPGPRATTMLGKTALNVRRCALRPPIRGGAEPTAS